MSGTLTEIRWHARGGQGAVTAAKMVAELAVERGRHFQAFPEYGPERSGAPIVAFTRISNEPIQIYSPIEHPDLVLVLDATLVAAIDVTEGAPDDAIVIVNTDQSPAAITAEMDFGSRRVMTVAATKIAEETIGKRIPNTPMVGAIAKATGMFTLDEIEEHMRESFGKKFSQKVVDGNVEAVRRAYNEVQG
ncbi:MAG: 2-oxoacid:acceptor oxidoreductase family protein [Thermoleophilia bacterium]